MDWGLSRIGSLSMHTTAADMHRGGVVDGGIHGLVADGEGRGRWMVGHFRHSPLPFAQSTSRVQCKLSCTVSVSHHRIISLSLTCPSFPLVCTGVSLTPRGVCVVALRSAETLKRHYLCGYMYSVPLYVVPSMMLNQPGSGDTRCSLVQ